MITVDVILPAGEKVPAAVVVQGEDVAQACDAAKKLCPDWVSILVDLRRDAPVMGGLAAR